MFSSVVKHHFFISSVFFDAVPFLKIIHITFLVMWNAFVLFFSSTWYRYWNRKWHRWATNTWNWYRFQNYRIGATLVIVAIVASITGGKPHYVTEKKSRFSCNDKFPRFNTYMICQHVVAAAHLCGMLRRRRCQLNGCGPGCWWTKKID